MSFSIGGVLLATGGLAAWWLGFDTAPSRPLGLAVGGLALIGLGRFLRSAAIADRELRARVTYVLTTQRGIAWDPKGKTHSWTLRPDRAPVLARFPDGETSLLFGWTAVGDPPAARQDPHGAKPRLVLRRALGFHNLSLDAEASAAFSKVGAVEAQADWEITD